MSSNFKKIFYIIFSSFIFLKFSGFVAPAFAVPMINFSTSNQGSSLFEYTSDGVFRVLDDRIQPVSVDFSGDLENTLSDILNSARIFVDNISTVGNTTIKRQSIFPRYSKWNREAL